jgi:hypothetical protein
MIHARFDIIHHLTRTLIVVSFSLLPSTNVLYLWIVTVIFAVSSLLSAFVYIWYQPYHRFEASLIQSVVKSVVAWCGVCLIVVQLFNNENKPVGAVMLYVVSPVIVVLVGLILQQRKQHVENKEVTKCVSVYEIELKTRMILQVKIKFYFCI